MNDDEHDTVVREASLCAVDIFVLALSEGELARDKAGELWGVVPFVDKDSELERNDHDAVLIEAGGLTRAMPTSRRDLDSRFSRASDWE